jgi:hypothetical protein
VFANQEEEDVIYPVTSIETAKAQQKDQELKVFYKQNCKNTKGGDAFSTY